MDQYVSRERGIRLKDIWLSIRDKVDFKNGPRWRAIDWLPTDEPKPITWKPDEEVNLEMPPIVEFELHRVGSWNEPRYMLVAAEGVVVERQRVK